MLGTKLENLSRQIHISGVHTNSMISTYTDHSDSVSSTMITRCLSIDCSHAFLEFMDSDELVKWGVGYIPTIHDPRPVAEWIEFVVHTIVDFNVNPESGNKFNSTFGLRSTHSNPASGLILLAPCLAPLGPNLAPGRYVTPRSKG